MSVRRKHQRAFLSSTVLVPASAASLGGPRQRGDGGRRRVKLCVFCGEPMSTNPSVARSTTRSGRSGPERGPQPPAEPQPSGPAGRMPFVFRSPRGPFRGLPREVPILTAISFTVALGFGIVAPDIPAFARHFGVSTAAAASVVSAFALMRIVGALPAGRLADRFGQATVMATGIAIVAVSSIVAGFSGSFTELIILRGAGGLGSAMFGVSAQTLLLVSVPTEQRGRASGLYAGGFLVGGISGPAVGGLIAAWSMRAPFIIYGVLLVIPAVIAISVLRDGSRRRTAPPPSAARG